MRAVRFVDGEAKVVAAEPTVPEYATDPVTVHVKSCSICGSDLHLLTWGIPCTVGHEFAGVLDDGTPVAVQPYVPCGVCDQCLAGETRALSGVVGAVPRHLGRRWSRRRGDRRPRVPRGAAAGGPDRERRAH